MQFLYNIINTHQRFETLPVSPSPPPPPASLNSKFNALCCAGEAVPWWDSSVRKNKADGISSILRASNTF